jgi:hypothetical protein
MQICRSEIGPLRSRLFLTALHESSRAKEIVIRHQHVRNDMIVLEDKLRSELFLSYRG